MNKNAFIVLQLLFLAAISSCKKDNEPAKELDPFKRIKCSGNVTISLVSGSENKVLTTTLENMSYSSSGNLLSINASSGTMTIAVKDLDAITMNSGSIANVGLVQLPALKLTTNASSVNFEDFHITGIFEGRFSNTGTYQFKGTAGYIDVNVKDNVLFKGKDFAGDSVRFYNEASGNQEIHAVNILRASIIGSGNVYYKGSPAIVDTNTLGTGHFYPF